MPDENIETVETTEQETETVEDTTAETTETTEEREETEEGAEEQENEEEENKVPVVEVKLALKGKTLKTTMLVSSKLDRRQHKIELGRQYLRNFIIRFEDGV